MPKDVSSAVRRFPARGQFVSSIESLEHRTMLSVALDSAGWTVVTPPAGARVIYCSSSSGNDNNSGLSPNSPVQTLARGESLLQDHTGDQLLLKAGDVFYGNFIFWTLSGASAQEPIVIGSYGTGARPEIMTGTKIGLETGSAAPEVDYVDIIGINFDANSRDPNLTKTPDTSSNPSGIEFLTKSEGILVENCEFRYYSVDVTFQEYLGPISDVTIRRNIIIDSYAVTAHSQGLYAYGVTNLTVEGNLFNADGYNAQVPGADATVFNQDCYISANNSNCVIEDNIFANAASTGLEDRPGGLVEDNLFVDDPVGLNFGLVNGADTTVGGVTGQVTGNVFIGGGNIGNLPEGQALCVGNIAPGAGAMISDNIFTQGGAGSVPAVTLEPGKSQIDPQDSVGINDLTLENNVFYDWSTGIDVAAGMSAGGTGLTAYNRVHFINNQFENLTGPSMENHSASYLAQETFSGNTFYNSGQWVVNSLKSAVQGTTLTTPIGFANPNVTVATYDKSIGNSGTLGDFLALAAQQSEASWNSNYEGAAVTAYFSQAFNLNTSTPRKAPTPTPTPTPTATPTPTPTPTPTGTAHSATSTIQAVNYTADKGIPLDGFGGIGSNGGDWAEYSDINFGTGVTTFQAEIAGLAQCAGSIQLRLDSPTGALIGTLKIAGTGAWNNYTLQSTTVKGATGVHNLYLVFVGADGTGNVKSFNFVAAPVTPAQQTSRPATSTIQAVNYTADKGIPLDGFGGIGSNGGDWAEYSDIDFGSGVTTFKALIAGLSAYVGSIQLRLDSPTGTLIGTLKVAGTGAWNKYTLQSTAVKGATGIHNLYLVFVGGGGTGNVESFSFS